MNSLDAFMKQNAVDTPNLRVVISERFIGNDGKPVEWEIRFLREDENALIRKNCMSRDFSRQARKSGQTLEFDSTKYVQRLAVASVVFPDLKDAALQTSYGVVGEEKLLIAMLTANEYSYLQEIIDTGTGYISREPEEDKEEIKNF